MISTWTPILILFDNAFQQQPPPPVISKATSSSNEVGTDGTGTGSEEDERALPPHQRLLNEHKRKWSGNRDNGGHGHNSHDLSLAARRSPAAMAAAAAAAVAGTGPPPERLHPVKLLCPCFRFLCFDAFKTDFVSLRVESVRQIFSQPKKVRCGSDSV